MLENSDSGATIQAEIAEGSSHPPELDTGLPVYLVSQADPKTGKSTWYISQTQEILLDDERPYNQGRIISKTRLNAIIEVVTEEGTKLFKTNQSASGAEGIQGEMNRLATDYDNYPTYNGFIKAQHSENGCELTLHEIERIRGVNLQEFIESHHAGLHPEMSIMIFENLMQELSRSLQQGLIHRDIKPANIMICFDENDEVEVRIIDPLPPKVFNPSQFAGSPNYTAPELAEKQHPEKLSDDDVEISVLDDPIYVYTAEIYAAHLVLYEMLFGERFFNFGFNDWQSYFEGFRDFLIGSTNDRYEKLLQVKTNLNNDRFSHLKRYSGYVEYLEKQLAKDPDDRNIDLEELRKKPNIQAEACLHRLRELRYSSGNRRI
jgi:serine/threonine protein kinase